jgi:hypothetical protein
MTLQRDKTRTTVKHCRKLEATDTVNLRKESCCHIWHTYCLRAYLYINEIFIKNGKELIIN